MKLKTLLPTILLGMSILANTASAQVSYEHIRNATGKLTYNDTTFLIDPMLAEKGRYEGFYGSFNQEVRNPTVELPESKDSILKDVDAVIITHTHLDHWDDVAQSFIDKNLPIFVQDKKDADDVKSKGFKNVQILSKNTTFNNISLSYIEGTHGTQAMYDDEILGGLLGETMGIVFSAPNEKTTYIMGDTVWTQRISKTLRQYQPDIIIMNTGSAKALQFNESYIMGTADVAKSAAMLPEADIITVHMDAINHCTLSRQNMRNFIKLYNLEKKVHVPNDGEIINFK